MRRVTWHQYKIEMNNLINFIKIFNYGEKFRWTIGS